MPTLTNVIVNKVYKGASGEGQYGPWQAYNFYVKGDDRKFSCFDSKLAPVEGMAIVALEYEEEQSQSKKDGKWYTNNNVKTVMLPDTQEAVSDVQIQQLNKNANQTAPEPQGSTISPTKRDSSLTMYISYAKDIVVAKIQAGDEQYALMPVEDLGVVTVQVGINMYDKANGVQCADCGQCKDPFPNEESNMPDNTQEPQYHGDEPPLGEPPYGT